MAVFRVTTAPGCISGLNDAYARREYQLSHDARLHPGTPASSMRSGGASAGTKLSLHPRDSLPSSRGTPVSPLGVHECTLTPIPSSPKRPETSRSSPAVSSPRHGTRPGSTDVRHDDPGGTAIRTYRRPGTRIKQRTSGGPRGATKTPPSHKFLRRRTASPGALRAAQIADDLAMLLRKHKDETAAEEMRAERIARIDSDRIAFEHELQKRSAVAQFVSVDSDNSDSIDIGEFRAWMRSLNPGATDQECQARFDAMDVNHDGLVSRKEWMEMDAMQRVYDSCSKVHDEGLESYAREGAPDARSRSSDPTPMQDLGEEMRSSFTNSLEQLTTETNDALEQRRISVKAAKREYSSLLRTLVTLRGQRHGLKKRFDEEKHRQLSDNPNPIQPAIVDTAFGTVDCGDKVLSPGDEETLRTVSLEAQHEKLLGLSKFSGKLSDYMPPLVDIARQHAELELELSPLSGWLSCLKADEQHALATGTLEGHSEKLLRQRDTMRHSNENCGGTINSASWYRGDDFQPTKSQPVPLTNYPFKAHYPHLPQAPVHCGEIKALARQALSRMELSDTLCHHPANRGLVPALPPITSQRVAPHMHNVLSCYSTEDKEHISRGSWDSWQSIMSAKSTLEPHTGKLINSSMKLADSTVPSNSHQSTLSINEHLRQQATRSWASISAPGKTPHPINCCCLACSMRLQGEHPATHALYHRLCTHEAGNTQSFARPAKDALRDQDVIADTHRSLEDGGHRATPRNLHPQIPHGFRGPMKTSPTMHAASVEAKSPRLKQLRLPQAMRGGVVHHLLYAASVEGLAESVCDDALVKRTLGSGFVR